MKTSRSITQLSFLTVVLFALVAAGCGGANGPDSGSGVATASGPPKRSVRVETLRLNPDQFEEVIEMTGTVESVNDAMLSAQSAGTVEYLAPLGQRVGRGTAIARLDQGILQAALRQAEAQVAAAQAQLELAEDTHRRQEPLYRDSIISALEFQNVRAQLNQARAQLMQAEAAQAQAQEQLDNTVITAPFAGTVEAHFVEEGEQIMIGQSVARVVSTRRVKVTVGVPERYAGDIEVGTPVYLDFQAYRGAPRQGVVTFSGSAINPDNRTFPVEIEVDNSNGGLKPQMVARVMVTRTAYEGVLVVPRSAVLRDENGTSVFVVAQEDGEAVASRRMVTLGSAYGGRVILEDGVSAGDEVIVLGQTTVTEGDALEIVEQYSRLDANGVLQAGGVNDTVEVASLGQ